MSKASERIQKRRLRSSNITVVASIALVLFLLGLFGLIVLNSSDYANKLKNKFEIEAYFIEAKDKKDIQKEEQVHAKFLEELKQKDFIKKLNYIPKKEAVIMAKQQLGLSEDDLALFEEGIFPPSVVMTIQPAYVDSIRIDSITQVIAKYPLIKSVNHTAQLASIYERIDRLIYWLIGLAAVFLIVSIVLINNSLRLKIFSKRFTIKTMQLVGAKRRFIIAPFLKQSFWLGFLGALIAVLGLAALWHFASPRLGLPYWNEKFTYLIAGIFIVGIFIAVASTFVAAWRYLKLQTDQLYYS